MSTAFRDSQAGSCSFTADGADYRDSAAYGYDPTPFKQAFRRLASGVVVIAFDVGSDIHGFTATSLTPVSMQPPLALFCVGNHSRSRPHLEPGRKIGLSIMSREQAETTQFFAARRPFGQCGEIDIIRFGGVPVVADSLANISAVIEETLPAGDHAICICSLHKVYSTSQGEPLVYFAGGYGCAVPLLPTSP